MSDLLKNAKESGIFHHTLIELMGGGEYNRPNDRSFAPGSRVLLHNGTHKNIEDLEPFTIENPTKGDKLLSVDGEWVYVVGLMKGPEETKIIELSVETTNSNYPKKILKTRINGSHAILKDQSHLVAASRLQNDDKIQTQYGVGKILSTNTVQLTQNVWNVFLSSEDFVINRLPNINVELMPMVLWNSLLGLSPKQHIICVDGILSGDWNLQEQLDGFYRSGVSLTLLS